MFISFNTDELTAEDRQVLAVLAGTSAPIAAKAAELAERAGVGSTPAKKTAPKPAPKADPDPAEDSEESTPETSGEYTLKDAVDKATELVSDGKAKDVKAALKKIAVAKVSELDVEAGDVDRWFAALAEIQAD